VSIEDSPKEPFQAPTLFVAVAVAPLLLAAPVLAIASVAPVAAAGVVVIAVARRGPPVPLAAGPPIVVVAASRLLGIARRRVVVTVLARGRSIPAITWTVPVAIGAAPPLVALTTRRLPAALTRGPLVIAVAAAMLPVTPGIPRAGRLAGETAEAHDDPDHDDNEPALPTGAAHIHTPSVASTARSRPPRPPDTPGPSPRRETQLSAHPYVSPEGEASGCFAGIVRILGAGSLRCRTR
jgi:hypothetical protein